MISGPDYEILPCGYGSGANSEDFKTGVFEPRLVLIIWPSSGGNARSFRIKESELVDQKILLLRYNPTSHGNARGTYDPKLSIEHLLQYLISRDLQSIPVVGIGHSGGGAAMLMIGERLHFQKRFLLSPILDSRESLFYLYRAGHIQEFLQLLNSSPSPEINEKLILERRSMIESILGNPNWLLADTFEDLFSKLSFPVANQRIHLDNLADFLKNLFLPGFSLLNEVENVTSPIQIFLPTDDHWFPREVTWNWDGRAFVRVTEIERAKDHFFSSAWQEVWQKIRSEIYT
jgi:hypothetical protein